MVNEDMRLGRKLKQGEVLLMHVVEVTHHLVNYIALKYSRASRGSMQFSVEAEADAETAWEGRKVEATGNGIEAM